MARINAQMKGDVITVATDAKFKLQRVPTGSLVIDRITGGGFARGRHIVLYGDWSACKSLLLYMTLVLAQKRGEVCALVDGEGVFDSAWFEFLGGNAEDLLLYEPKTADQLAKVLQLFVQKSPEVDGVDICGIDSVASMLPQEELDKDIEEGDDRVASLARMMSRLLRRVTTQNDDTTFIWTNQWREKISRIPGQKSQPGGTSLGFYSSISVEMQLGPKETVDREVVRKGAWVKRKVAVGQWVNATAKKNKTTIPLQEGSFMFDFPTRGISRTREIIDLGMTDGIIKRTGDNYITEDQGGKQYKSHGVKRFIKTLEGNDELYEWLVSCIEEKTAEAADG